MDVLNTRAKEIQVTILPLYFLIFHSTFLFCFSTYSILVFLVIFSSNIEIKVSSIEIAPSLDTSPDLKSIPLGLSGIHQRLNASLAVALVKSALTSLSNSGYHFLNTERAIIDGLLNTRWPGRCQIIQVNHVKWYLDGAHTRESVQVCCYFWFGSTKK